MSVTSTVLPAGPLVFQCADCKTILSDSQEFVCTLTAPDGAKFVVLKGVSDARVDSIAHSTHLSPDNTRTTHFSVCCASCGTAVGRLYTEVAAPLPTHLCNLFCLEVSRCLSYQLGSAEIRAVGGNHIALLAEHAQQQQQQQPAALASGDMGQAAPPAAAAGVDGSLVLELLQRVESLEASLCTLQGIQVLHDAQLRTLPNYQAEAHPGAAAAAGAIS